MMHCDETTIANLFADKGVVFEICLPTGPTELVTYLYDKTGKAGGADFTEVELLERQ